MGEEGNYDAQSHKRHQWNQQILDKKPQIFESILFPWIMIHLFSQLDKAGKKILKRTGHAFVIQ